MNTPRSVFLFCCLLIASVAAPLFGQGWEHFTAHYPGSNSGKFKMCYAQDSGIVVLATTATDTPNFNSRSAWVRKFDQAGNLLWEKFYNSAFRDEGVSIRSLPGGGFALLAHSLDSVYDRHFVLYRLDAQGDSLWSRRSYENFAQTGSDLVVTKDGNIVVEALEYPASFSNERLLLAKFDLQGDTLWSKRYEFTYNSYLRWNYIEEGPDSSLVLIGFQDANDLIVKCNPQGDTLWSKSIGYGLAGFHDNNLHVSDQGDIYYNTESPNPSPTSSTPLATLVKLNGQGVFQWDEAYSPFFLLDVMLLEPQPGGGFVLGGGYAAATHGGTDMSLIYVDSAGIFQRVEDYGYLYREDAHALLFANNGDKYVFGRHMRQSANGNFTYLLKTDSTGEVHPNRVSGTVYDDINGNCQQDLGEGGFVNWIVQLTPGPLWAITDSNGHYEVPADTGAFTVSTFPAWPYREVTCPASPTSLNGTFTASGQTQTGFDFATQATDSCPYLWVDVGAARLNHNRASTYTVLYCNQGTKEEQNVSLTITLDSALVLDSASMAWNTPQSGTQFVFDVGTLAPGTCGTLDLHVFLSGATVPRGLTHCVRAELDPHTTCQVVDPNWNGASLAVEGWCGPGDSVFFRIRNIGSANTATHGGLLVHEDDILRVQDNVWLNVGQERILAFPGNGATWTCRLTQPSGHPGQSRPRAYVEACGINNWGTYSTRIVNHFPEDDLDPWVSELCFPSVGISNLARKVGFPQGTFSERFILPEQWLEYSTTYENRSLNDITELRIQDWIPESLELPSFRLGASSHPYRFVLTPAGIAEWHFENVLITDSLDGLPNSMAYVNYRINQQTNPAPGTEYRTRAAFTKDMQFHTVSAHQTLHTVSDTAFGLLSLDPVQPPLQQMIKAYPNPFRDAVNFELPDEVWGTVTLEVFGLDGQLILAQDYEVGHPVRMERKNLPEGMYLFRLRAASGLLGSGRILVR